VIVVKTAAALLATYAITAAMRRRAASLRHAVLAAGFAIVCALPLLERTAPGWGGSLAPEIASLPQVSANDASILRVVWYAGAAIGLLLIAVGAGRIASLRRTAVPIDARRQALAEEVVAEFGVRRPVVFLETARASMPMTSGLLRPAVFVPYQGREWSDDTLRAVLRHEVAHVVRGDWAVQLIVAAITRVFWFDPVMWMASRRLRMEGERACDDAVLNLGVDGGDYATQIVTVARTISGRAHFALAPSAAGRGGFVDRIAAALDPAIDRTPLSVCALMLVAVAFIAAAIPLAGFGEPASQPEPSLLAVQRDILRRFGGEQRRVSISADDVSFRKSRIEGRVELLAYLNTDGSVSAVRILEPVHPDLASAAKSIVRQWRREPALVRGVPVEIPLRMTVDFRR